MYSATSNVPGLTNVGQIHERLATGDEAMLAIDGIGPKGLTEIKQTIEDKGLGLVPLPEPTPVELKPVAEAPAETPVVVEPVAEVVVEAAPVAEVPAAETPAAVIEAVAPETGPAVKPAGDGEVAPAIVVPAEVVEEAEDEDELDRKTGKKKAKRKDRMLVLDESTGVVVAKKQRKAGRGQDLYGLVDDEEIL